MATLIITEKEKAAKSIADALGSSKLIKKQNTSKVYYIPSRDIYVLPLRGHILEYRNTSLYKSWTNSNPRDIITNSNAIKKFPIKNTNQYINALKKYSKICNHCIIGTDADIEGCNIGLFDALHFVRQINKNISISQIWLSSLQKNEIQKKFNQRISPKWSWADTGEARAIIDATIGFSATREVTNTFKPLLQKLNKTFISIGRVQSSLLYLIYLRDHEINNFKPEVYWTIDASLITQNKVIKAFHDSNPFEKDKENIVKTIYQTIRDEKIAHIVNNNNNIISKKPPIPLNTTQALILLTKNLKINGNIALRTMEALYLNKIISYPRTDSNVYKDDFDHTQYLKNFSSHSKYGHYVSNVFREKRFQPTKGNKDAGDHPPITTLESLELTSPKFENDLQMKVYDLLARHYLALFGKNAKESKTVLKLVIKAEPFTSKITVLISEGFFEIVPFLKGRYDTEINISGNKIPVKTIILNSKQTQPRPHYTDVSLLKLMEKHHLGTKSTRPKIIEILVNRTLIQRVRRQYLISEIGRILIDQLKIIWLPFLKPQFTRSVELLLEDIKSQKKKKEDVIKIVKETFLALFDRFLVKKTGVTKRLSTFKTSLPSPKPLNGKIKRLTIAKCLKCKTNHMELVTTYQKKRFLACTDKNCKTYLSVPKRGRIQLLKSACSICGFDIFKIFYRKNNRTLNYYICPRCWNEGFDSKNSGKGFCSKCTEYKILNEQCIKK